ncbi:MAG: alanine racemase [Treponema sp.]|nr:alanine racemase [Treponema sp.]
MAEIELSGIPQLAEKYGTPFYLFDEDELKERVAQIKSRLPGNSRLCYAIKANAFAVGMLKDDDILFEVCSPGELTICEKAGLSPSKIVFSGVCKTFEDVRRAYDLKVNTITLESKTHLAHLVRVLESQENHPQDVIIRLTSGNQFGMSERDVYDCVAELKKYESINIRGIHFFTGTQKKLKKIAEEITYIESFCDTLQSETGITFSSIEYGPGLGYDYFSGKDESRNFTDLEEFVTLMEKSRYDYVLEMGRYVASSFGTYVTRIMDVKGDEKNRYCIIDGGINHINYYGQMMGMKNPRTCHAAGNPSSSEVVDCTIAGSLCTTADVVLRKLSLASPAEGDFLAFRDIGAYSVTEGIYLFLSHPLPAILKASGKDVELLRTAQETCILNGVPVNC